MDVVGASDVLDSFRCGLKPRDNGLENYCEGEIPRGYVPREKWPRGYYPTGHWPGRFGQGITQHDRGFIYYMSFSNRTITIEMYNNTQYPYERDSLTYYLLIIIV